MHLISFHLPLSLVSRHGFPLVEDLSCMQHGSWRNMALAFLFLFCFRGYAYLIPCRQADLHTFHPSIHTYTTVYVCILGHTHTHTYTYTYERAGGRALVRVYLHNSIILFFVRITMRFFHPSIHPSTLSLLRLHYCVAFMSECKYLDTYLVADLPTSYLPYTHALHSALGRYTMPVSPRFQSYIGIERSKA